MAIVIEAPDPNEEETRHKFAKMMLGTAAAFIAKDLVENLYDSLLKKYRESHNQELPI